VPALPDPVGYVAGGNFAPLGTYTGIVGRAQILRRADGTATVQLHVEGLAADTAYPAHVHALPCEVDTGGGHYKLDPSVATTVEANEIWPVFTTDAAGVGQASVDVTVTVRPDAQSIVIHDPSVGPPAAKMACVNLVAEPLATTTSSGTFAPFAGATGAEQNVAGTATLVRSASGTEVTLNTTGLDPAGTYVAHVHALPCAVGAGGGHYKIDPLNTGTVEANELWPAFGGDASAGSASITSSHVARADAQSVVIHRTDLGTPAPKVACADLVQVEAYGAYVTEGTAVALPDATTQGVAGVAGTATMSRSLTTTETSISVTGLLASTAYAIHVHDHTCAFTPPGGGHYKRDASILTTVEANEIWLNLTTDGAGAGTQALTLTDHVARPEGGSIIVHDTSVAPPPRVACIDLL
jgi:hypothetical protein